MIDRIPVSQAAARKVQKMIQDGIFPVDQKLPSQRILAERLGISRPSLREALLTLETLGQIKTYPGRGTFVTRPGAQVAGGTAGWRYDTEHSLHSVFEMRILLEERLARHAATLATLEDITLLHSLADQMEAAWAQQDLVANVEADWAFHRHIASKTTNTLLAKTYEKFAALLTETQRTPIPFTHDARMSESIAEHRQIIAALNDRDADTAGRVMAAHIRNTAARADVIV